MGRLSFITLTAFIFSTFFFNNFTSKARATVKKASSKKVHGWAMRTQPKYKKGFKHFDWANPNAPKGGTLKLATTAPFDSINPFALKGMSAGLLTPFVFESLTMSSLDEPMASYGLLAESMSLAKDGLSTTFYLRPNAKFSDGKPVTADDVVFSFNTFMSEGAAPYFRWYWADIKEAKAINKKTVKFIFKRKNPELHIIIGQMDVLPKHFYSKGKFGTDFALKALGSGPYLIKKFKAAKIIEIERNPNYWGKNLNVNVGRFNYDKLVMKVFRDEAILVEGFKAGEFDYHFENNSKRWAVDIKGKKWDNNWILKRFMAHKRTAGMQGYALNLRRPVFQNKNVRMALAYAFDFEWSNKTLFYNQYKQFGSYWDNSVLGARGKGLPSADELKLLNPLKGKIPDEVFTQELKPLGMGWSSRDRLRKAMQILKKDGWQMKNGVLTKGKQKLEFKFLLNDKAFARITEPYINNMKKIGINASIDLKDRSIYAKKAKGFNYDVIVSTFGQSESPGNEQISFWHSSSADTEGSRNLMGIKNPAIDILIDKIITAPSREDLVTATRALDRVLWFNYYIVPHWFISGFRVTYWNQFGVPKKVPPYYWVSSWFQEYSWFDQKKAKELTKAIKTNIALSKN